jgi:hypothetical protein
VRELTGPDWTNLVSADFSPDGSRVLVGLRAGDGGSDAAQPPMAAAILSVDGATPLVPLDLTSRNRLAEGSRLRAGIPTEGDATQGAIGGASPDPASPDGTAAVLTDAGFSPAGDLVAVGTQDGTVAVFDAGSGDLVHSDAPTTQPVYQVGFTPDGRVLSSSGDRHVRVVDPRSGRVERDIPLDASWPMGAVAAADGTSVTVFASDGSVTTMPLDDDALVDLVRSKVTRHLRPYECTQYELTTC